MGDLNDLVQKQPQYQIIPALLSSLSLSCSTSVAIDLIVHFPQPIQAQYVAFLSFLQPWASARGPIDPRSYEAIISLPQARISRGAEWANALQLVLRRFLGYRWTSEHLRPNPHERWLYKTKPFKHISQGSPKLAYAFYSHLLTLPTFNPKEYDDNVSITIFRHSRRKDRGKMLKNFHRNEECFVHLNTIIHYLRKCDRASALVKLARKSLPKAALWFPKLMKKARAETDIYVRRWEGMCSLSPIDNFLNHMF